jgi:hypothetical protein
MIDEGCSTPAKVALEFYDVCGRLVGKGGSRAFATAGTHTTQWEMDSLAAGVYFLRFVAATGSTAPAKLVVVR